MIDWKKDIQTSDGAPARVLAMDLEGDFPIAIAVTCNNGEKFTYEVPYQCDFSGAVAGRTFQIIQKKREISGWINIYKGLRCGTTIYPTKVEADQGTAGNRIACAYIATFEKD